MGINQKLRYGFYSESVLAGITLVFISFLPQPKVEFYRLWEIFPAILASMITTYGLWKMHKKT